jgi:hypothetical protein
MRRRSFSCFVPALFVTVPTSPRANVRAGAPMSNAEAALAVRTLLELAAASAVASVGRPDGFFANARIRIPLPGFLIDTARFLRAVGRGGQVDELELAMNRVAETAVASSRDVILAPAKTITAVQARQVLAGGENAATALFADRTRAQIAAPLLASVNEAARKLELEDKYQRVAGRGADGWAGTGDSGMAHYVARKALEGLYLVLAEEERKLRRDPAGSVALRKAFGSSR